MLRLRQGGREREGERASEGAREGGRERGRKREPGQFPADRDPLGRHGRVCQRPKVRK